MTWPLHSRLGGFILDQLPVTSYPCDDGADAVHALSVRHEFQRNGTPVLIRRLVLQDAALYPDFLREVTSDDLRLRFFARMREVRPELLDKLIHYDPARAMAFVAIDEQTGKLLGVVRLHNDRDQVTTEFAILTRSRLKGQGIGWLLMKHIIEFAKCKDLKAIYGQVLCENTNMLAMCSELGFRIKDDPADRGIKMAKLSLCTE